MSSNKANSLTTVLLSKSLSTMVKGIRAHKDKGEAEYIAKCLQECKDELKSSFPDVKAMALKKLIYLQMFGYDVSWAAFHIVEVMSASWYAHRRVAYLSASLTFTKDTDVILLTTHLFRKAFTQTSTNTNNADGLQYETGSAISALANIVTPDLAEGLLSDVYGMMNSSRPYLRKKSTLVLLRIFQQWPKALRLSFDRLKEKLTDESQGVVSAAVYVICELAAKNPGNYLALAPQFFKILTTSSNNWVLIKVVKLLGSLVPLEPRLAKKLVDPLTDIITTTPAKSLLYECINTMLSGKITSKSVIRLCLDKLKTFIENPDQNLKYLGLYGLNKLMKAQPRAVQEHKELILACLSDDDVTIRHRALDLITQMVTKRNLQGITRRLIEHLEASDGNYKEAVLERIIYICSQKSFAFISDFEWYITTLVDLTHLQGITSRDNALRIQQQWMEVAIRVPLVRRFAVGAMSQLLISGRLADASGQNQMSEVLLAAAWITGEYSDFIEDHVDLARALTKQANVSLSYNVQVAFIQCLFKVLSSALLQPYDLDAARVKAQQAELQQERANEEKQRALQRQKDEEEFKAEQKLDDFDPMSMDLSGQPAAGAAAATTSADKKEESDENISLDDKATEKKTSIAHSKSRTFAEWLRFIDDVLQALIQGLPNFTHSSYVEVQERAVSFAEFVKFMAQAGGFIAPDTKKDDSKDKSASSSSSADSRASESAKDLLPLDKPAVAAEPPKPAAPVVMDILGGFDPLAPSAPAAAAASAPVEPQKPSPSPPPAIDLSGQPSASPDNKSSSSANNSNNPAAHFASIDERKRFLASLAGQLQAFFAEGLNPVHPKAQKKVPLPAGLDLDKRINDEEDEIDEEEDDYLASLGGGSGRDRDRGDRDGDAGDSKKGDRKSGKRSKKFDDDDGDGEWVKPATEEEKRAAAARQKALKEQRMNDPFYIKDSKTTLLNDADTADIPLQKLEAGSLPPVKIEKSSKKDKDRRKKRGDSFEDDYTGSDKPEYTVNVSEELPEGAEADDDPKSKPKDDDDNLAVDLTSPLRADEVMPRQLTYAEQQANKKDDKASKDGKDSGKDGKSSKDRDRKKGSSSRSDRDRDGKRSSSRRDGHRSSSRRDKSDKEKSDKDKGDKKDDKPSSDNKPAATANVLGVDMFDPMAASSSSSSAAASNSNSGAAAAASSSADSKSESKEDSRVYAANKQRLYKDSTIKVSYYVKPNGAMAESKKSPSGILQLKIKVEKLSSSSSSSRSSSSRSSKKPKELASITLEFQSTKRVRVAAVGGPSKGKPVDGGVVINLANVPEGSEISESVRLDWLGPLDGPAKLSALVSHADDKGKGKSKKPADFTVGVSSFVVPKNISLEELATVLSPANALTSLGPIAAAGTGTCTAAAKKVLDVGDMATALDVIESVLHVKLLQAKNWAASYYGQLCCDNQHITVYVKGKKEDKKTLSVEIKTPSDQLSNALLDELAAHFAAAAK